MHAHRYNNSFSAGMFAEHGSEGKKGPHTSLDLVHLLPNKVGSSLRASLGARGAHSRQDAFTQVRAETSVTPRPPAPLWGPHNVNPTSPTGTTQGSGQTGSPGSNEFAELSTG